MQDPPPSSSSSTSSNEKPPTLPTLLREASQLAKQGMISNEEKVVLKHTLLKEGSSSSPRKSDYGGENGDAEAGGDRKQMMMMISKQQLPSKSIEATHYPRRVSDLTNSSSRKLMRHFSKIIHNKKLATDVGNSKGDAIDDGDETWSSFRSILRFLITSAREGKMNDADNSSITRKEEVVATTSSSTIAQKEEANKQEEGGGKGGGKLQTSADVAKVVVSSLPVVLRQISDMKDAGLIDGNNEEEEIKIELIEMQRTIELLRALKEGPIRRRNSNIDNNDDEGTGVDDANAKKTEPKSPSSLQEEEEEKKKKKKSTKQQQTRAVAMEEALKMWGKQIYEVAEYIDYNEDSDNCTIHVSATIPIFLKARMKKPVGFEICMALPLNSAVTIASTTTTATAPKQQQQQQQQQQHQQQQEAPATTAVNGQDNDKAASNSDDKDEEGGGENASCVLLRSLVDSLQIQAYLRPSMQGKAGKMKESLETHLKSIAMEVVKEKQRQKQTPAAVHQYGFDLISKIIDGGRKWVSMNEVRLKKLRRRSRSQSRSRSRSFTRARNGAKKESDKDNIERTESNEIDCWNILGELYQTSPNNNDGKEKKKNKNKKTGATQTTWHPEKLDTQIQKRSWSMGEAMGVGSGEALQVIIDTVAAIEMEEQRLLANKIALESKKKLDTEKSERRTLRQKAIAERKRKQNKRTERKSFEVPRLSQHQLAAMSMEEQIEYVARWSGGEMANIDTEKIKKMKDLKKKRDRVTDQTKRFQENVGSHARELSRAVKKATAAAASLDDDGNEQKGSNQLADSKNYEHFRKKMREDFYDVDDNSKHRFSCEICFEDFPRENGLKYAGACRHEFCVDCWKGYLTSQIDQGKSIIKCPGFKCKEFVEDTVVMALCPKLYPKYRSWITNMYVKCKGYRWCVGNGCEMVAVGGDYLGNVHCKVCDSEYCFSCGSMPHWPVPCKFINVYEGDILENKRQRCVQNVRNNGGRANLKARREQVSFNMKKCPKCRTPWFKDGGCNHFSCPCGHHFCWICLGPWQDHGNSFYKCVRKKEYKTSALKLSFSSEESWNMEIDRLVVNEVTHAIFSNDVKKIMEEKREKTVRKVVEWCSNPSVSRSYIRQVASFLHKAHVFIRSAYIFIVVLICSINVVPKGEEHWREMREYKVRKKRVEIIIEDSLSQLEQMEYLTDLLDQIFCVVPNNLLTRRDRYQLNDTIRGVQKYAVQTSAQFDLARQQFIGKDGDLLLTIDGFTEGLKFVANKSAETIVRAQTV